MRGRRLHRCARHDDTDQPDNDPSIAGTFVVVIDAAGQPNSIRLIIKDFLTRPEPGRATGIRFISGRLRQTNTYAHLGKIGKPRSRQAAMGKVITTKQILRKVTADLKLPMTVHF